jgi:hypothetical protein
VVSPKPPPAWIVRLNVAMLRRGLRLGSQHLLSVRGRSSGLPRSTPDVRRRSIELPVEKREPILRAFLEQMPGGARFFGSADPDVVSAAADCYPVFRVDPLAPSG